MKKRLKSALLASFALASLALPSWSEGQYWAVIVGVDDYAIGDIPKLKYAVADAKLFSQVLQKSAKVPKDHIRLLTSDSVQDGFQPRLTNVMQNLSDLRSKLKPEDTLVFYFAGHGLTVNDQSFLLTEESDNRSEATLRNSSIRNDELTKLFKEASPQNAVIIIDACRNRVSDKNKSTALQTLSQKLQSSINPYDIARENGSVIFSCDAGERAWEWEAKKHGIFSYFLTEGLRQYAADTTGKVTLKSLAAYVRQEVLKSNGKSTQSAQNPVFHLTKSKTTDWVLAQVAPNLMARTEPQRDAFTDKYIVELEQQQAENDHSLALQVYREQRAMAETSRHNELNWRLALLEKSTTSEAKNEEIKQRLQQIKKMESSLENSGEVNDLAYSNQGAGGDAAYQQAVTSERQRLGKENQVLSSRVELQESICGKVARNATLQAEVDQREAELKSAKADDGLARPLAERRLIEAKISLLESLIAQTSATDSESSKLRKLLELQRLATLAAEKRAALAEAASRSLSKTIDLLKIENQEKDAIIAKQQKELKECQSRIAQLEKEVEDSKKALSARSTEANQADETLNRKCKEAEPVVGSIYDKRQLTAIKGMGQLHRALRIDVQEATDLNQKK